MVTHWPAQESDWAKLAYEQILIMGIKQNVTHVTQSANNLSFTQSNEVSTFFFQNT